MNAFRALPVFSIAFAAFYATGTFVNTTWLYYYPKIAHWNLGHLPRSDANGTPSAWYGFTTAALIGAAIVAAIYLAIPERFAPKVPAWLSVLTPLAAMLVVFYVIAKLFWIKL